MAQWLTSEQYGNGSDGALTISSNTTEAPIDSSCSGSSGQKNLSATNVSFASQQIILIHQVRGTGVGAWELNVIDSYTAGTITCKYNLANTYTDSGASQAQVRVLKQYSSVTINSGITYSAKSWNGNVGGIIGWMCNGTTTITGILSTNSSGYTYGISGEAQDSGWTGEGTENASLDQYGSASNNGSGGAGGGRGIPGEHDGGGGGGGGNGAAGSEGTGYDQGQGGDASGTVNLSNMTFGGGGGGGGGRDASGGNGGRGAGITAIFTKDIVITGTNTNSGANGSNGQASGGGNGGGGGGAGGSVLIKADTATLGTNLITASAGSAGTGYGGGGNGGAGAVGRIALYYGTSYTGSTTPTMNVTQDDNLIPSIISGSPMFFNGGLVIG